MPSWTQDNGTCQVYTFKAGLLSAMGHDLLFTVGKWSLSYEDEALEGSFDGTSFKIEGAVKDGQVQRGVLSAKDQRDILENIRKYVFKKHREENIRFSCDDVEEVDDGLEGDGVLTIEPNEHALAFEVSIDDGEATCEITLHQPDWKITPFKALMGALKVQPDIKVVIRVPWS